MSGPSALFLFHGRNAKAVAAWIVGGSLIVLLLWVVARDREPRWHGKRLSDWAAQYGTNHWAFRSTGADLEAEKAIRDIGTNAIPFLLKQLSARESEILRKLRTHLPAQWAKASILRDRSTEVRRTAAYGVAALGRNAAEAVPALCAIETNHPEVDGRYTAVFALRTLGPTAEPAIPFLIRCLTNQEFTIRDDAATALGAIGARADLVVPALIQFVAQTPNRQIYEIHDAIVALGKFGPEASAAVNVVRELLDHSDNYIREAATNCLRRLQE